MGWAEGEGNVVELWQKEDTTVHICDMIRYPTFKANNIETE